MAGDDSSRQKGLYYALEAEKSGVEAAKQQQAFDAAKLGGITNGLVEIAQEVSEREGIPFQQALKKAAADPSSGYSKLLNGFVANHPGVYRNVTNNPNRDMSEFADNPIAGVKHINDFSSYGNADELSAQYPNGAYQVNLRKRADTMPEVVMGGLASLLPESMEKIVPWTRNASSDPDDAMELISTEDMNEEIQRQQRLHGNTSPYLATKMAELSNPNGKNPYGQSSLSAAWRAAQANSGTYNDQVQKMDARNNIDPVNKFADKTFAYNQALATATSKGSTPTDQIVDKISDIVEDGDSGKIKGIPRFNRAQQTYEQLTNIVNHPDATAQQQQAYKGYLPKLKRQMDSSIAQYAKKKGMFKTGILERWDAEWFSSIPEEMDETAPLSRAIRIVRENPITGWNASSNDWGKEYVYLLKANGEEYADPEPLASFPTGMQEYLRREVGGAESPAPVDTSTNVNISKLTPENITEINKRAAAVRKMNGQGGQ